MYVVEVPPSSKFHPILLYGKRFWVTGHFEISAPNDPKITFNTKRSKVPHMHVAATPEPQISPPFCSMASGFELWANLWQVHQRPKMTLNTKWSKVPHPIYMLQLPPGPKFHSISLYGQRFCVAGQFETSAANDLKMILSTKRSKVTNICCVSTHESQISLCSALRRAFF